MNGQNENTVPVWAPVCIKLLQGPVYRTNNNDALWKLLQSWQSDIDAYFAVIGLHVFVENADGYAFLEQKEYDDEENPLPKLITERPLSLMDSLLCVLFREALDQFDSSQNQSAMLVLKESDIMDRLGTFLTRKKDETALYRKLEASLARLQELSFIRELGTDVQNRIEREFEIRRIIRGKVDSRFLVEFRDRLKDVLEEGGAGL